MSITHIATCCFIYISSQTPCNSCWLKQPSVANGINSLMEKLLGVREWQSTRWDRLPGGEMWQPPARDSPAPARSLPGVPALSRPALPLSRPTIHIDIKLFLDSDLSNWAKKNTFLSTFLRLACCGSDCEPIFFAKKYSVNTWQLGAAPIKVGIYPRWRPKQRSMSQHMKLDRKAPNNFYELF